MTGLDEADLAAIAELRGRLDPAGYDRIVTLNVNRPNKLKYLDVDRWLRKMWLDAKDAGLLLRAPLSILDLGTGPGYFPYICRSLGHDCIGLDRPDTGFYDELRAWVGTRVIRHVIGPRVPFPRFDRRFDLVTAFRAPFDIVRHEKRLFTCEEWSWLLDDLRDHVLAPGGAFHMRMNKDYPYEGSVFGTPELMELFIRRGAWLKPRSRAVHFAPLK